MPARATVGGLVPRRPRARPARADLSPRTRNGPREDLPAPVAREAGPEERPHVRPAPCDRARQPSAPHGPVTPRPSPLPHPSLSTDFHPTCSIFATAGADNEVKVWRLVEGADTRVEFLCTLQGHTKTVNAVRFSPNGECLASVSDGAFARLARARASDDGRADRLTRDSDPPRHRPAPQTPSSRSGDRTRASRGTR